AFSFPAHRATPAGAGLADDHASSGGGSLGCRPLLRLMRFTFAVAKRSDGPMSSTSRPYAERFSPPSVSHRDCCNRPTTPTRAPWVSDPGACSASSRHAVQARNSGSPSRYWPESLSYTRGVEATVNLATAVPPWVV